VLEEWNWIGKEEEGCSGVEGYPVVERGEAKIKDRKTEDDAS
jgi:hypothetical protein